MLFRDMHNKMMMMENNYNNFPESFEYDNIHTGLLIYFKVNNTNLIIKNLDCDLLHHFYSFQKR